MKTTNFLVVVAMLLFSLQDLIAQNCSHGATTSVRDNKLYLYFPTTSDNTYPEHGVFGVNTSPLAEFDVADLDSGIGTTTQLRDRVFELVTEDYCEFNVEVIKTTTMPNTVGISRWQIIGLGSDDSGIGLFGEAQDVDLNDNIATDYSRVYAGTFDSSYGGAGGALNGANSTLERWANAIAGTTSHEGAHNYGVAHGNSASRTGEDAQNNHILATGSTGLTGGQRATDRHFSDQSYELLAHNVGLNIMSVYNWDFINPNAVDAHQLEFTLLSSAASLSLSTWWNGNRSPWRDPIITDTGSTRTFQGTSYNEFKLTFSTDKSWIGGADGVVPGGAEFHVGAGFAESDLVIVYDAKLKNSGGTDLDLHPRMADFDIGTADLASGDFTMMMFNPNPQAGDLIIRDMKIQYLPRLADINAMLDDVPLVDVRGFPINPNGSCNPRNSFELNKNKKFRLAKFNDERSVDIIYDSSNCKPSIVNSKPGDMENGEVSYCLDGNALSLFPSTTVYVTATVVDPKAKYFDPQIGDFVVGPLETKIFYQFTGIVPDFNENGIDDLIDIREGTSVDENNNGVPDNVEPGQPDGEEDEVNKIPWWIYLILCILLLIILMMYFAKGKKKID